MGELERHLLGSATTRKVEKVTPSQDDDFVGVLKKNTPNRFALMGRSPGSVGKPDSVPEGRLIQALQAEDKLWTRGTALESAEKLNAEGTGG